MIRRRAMLPLALLLATGGAGISRAQDAAPPGRHDSNAPLDWVADRIEVQDRAHRATLIGNVRVVQQEMTLTADRVTANYTGSIANSGAAPPATPGAAPAARPAAPANGPQVQRLDATGNVVVTRPTEIAHGDYGIYDLDRKLITLIGHVTLDRNGSIVRGGRLVIDENSGRATVDGSNVGGAGSAGAGGRVSGRFTVPQNDKAGAKPAASTPPPPAKP